MKALKVFGCHDFYTGGKIIAFITLIENFARAAISLLFLLWTEEENQKLGSGNYKHFKRAIEKLLLMSDYLLSPTQK